MCMANDNFRRGLVKGRIAFLGSSFSIAGVVRVHTGELERASYLLDYLVLCYVQSFNSSGTCYGLYIGCKLHYNPFITIISNFLFVPNGVLVLACEHAWCVYCELVCIYCQ